MVSSIPVSLAYLGMNLALMSRQSSRVGSYETLSSSSDFFGAATALRLASQATVNAASDSAVRTKILRFIVCSPMKNQPDVEYDRHVTNVCQLGILRFPDAGEEKQRKSLSANEKILWRDRTVADRIDSSRCKL